MHKAPVLNLAEEHIVIDTKKHSLQNKMAKFTGRTSLFSAPGSEVTGRGL